MRKGLLSLAFLTLLLIPTSLSIIPSAQAYPNTWVIAFYLGSYPSGISPSNFTSITVNFTVPNYLQTSSGYLGFVLTADVEASEYINGLYVGTTYLALQLALTFVASTSTYVIQEQVWTSNGIEIYNNEELITLSPNTERFLILLYNYNDPNTAIGYLQANGNHLIYISRHHIVMALLRIMS
ncbi:hypothetical protein [Sulfurisphaera tokodaii]|uniref:Uncharacterized protein n=2 Tax=Sulfurisphaera tokodaii TaxID=111955 RepID=Q96ZW4_SULTO|nr:hypothetical protein [Sulfurisphaera tokodaii]BAB66809.1 hypothetical protein STK_17220 [Sulfurisphaera tokodaii str. 7]HII73337.1 hypothetical protein [Sulfurisphaera tokodaii]